MLRAGVALVAPEARRARPASYEFAHEVPGARS
jgi:hypothetical protein